MPDHLEAKLTKESNGPISGYSVVDVETTSSQVEELRKALAVVDRFRFAALKAAKIQEKNAEWTMLAYACKGNKVTVTIEQGACG